MKNRKIRFIVIGLIVIGYLAWNFVSTPRGDQKVFYTPSLENCSKRTSPVEWKYCIYTSPNGNSGSIVYLLHGRNLDEHAWNDDTFYTSMIQKQWSLTNAKPPTVVAISFGPVWLFTKKDEGKNGGLLDIFVNDVIPEIESKTGRPTKRIAMGESMGGLNSLLLAFQTDHVFDKVVSLCPSVYKESPFASLSIVNAFLKRTGADPKVIFGVMQIAKKYAASEQDWKILSPVELLKSADAAKIPEIYLSGGLYDKYGSYEGNEFFAETAKAKGIKVNWHPEYGGHCSIDIVSVANELL